VTAQARRLVVRGGALLGVTVALVVVVLLGSASPSQAHTPLDAGRAPSSVTTEAPVPADTTQPTGPHGPKGPSSGSTAGDGSVTIDLGLQGKPSSPVLLLVTLTLLSLAPAILLTCTSFTKILVVLGLTRNALGLQQTPPNQVLAGLALFLSLFIMTPTLTQMNDQGVQPYLKGDATAAQAFDAGVKPLRTFMLAQTGDHELQLLTNVAHRSLPATRDDVPLSTLVPAFVLSELRQAFIIGFIIFIPFLVIDIVVSGALMALGMMMMPPVMVSLPFKLLLFVLVDGWGLVITALVQSYG
jgi:flagellar biosynthetic protein FliP